MQFYGVCLEPGHISLVIEYMPQAATLQDLLADYTISLTLANKVLIQRKELLRWHQGNTNRSCYAQMLRPKRERKK